MIKIPPYLQPGDTIGMVCPGGYMAAERVQSCVDTLREWGWPVKTGLTVGSGSRNYFSGTDAERLEDLQLMLDDPKIKAILFGRGGYGLSRIIDRINFKKFREHPKWLIGFSDITALHAHVYANFGIATLHAPMAGAFEGRMGDDMYLEALRNSLEGKKIRYHCDAHPFNRAGEGVGELVGGNLALLAHCVGTDSDIKTRGRILFIEDVGEYLYNIDRMLRQLKRAGKLERLAGLMVGHFSETRDTDRPFGNTAEEIIREVVAEYNYPICFGFPVGHEKENLALKIGLGYKLKVGRKKTILEE